MIVPAVLDSMNVVPLIPNCISDCIALAEVDCIDTVPFELELLDWTGVCAVLAKKE